MIAHFLNEEQASSDYLKMVSKNVITGVENVVPGVENVVPGGENVVPGVENVLPGGENVVPDVEKIFSLVLFYLIVVVVN